MRLHGKVAIVTGAAQGFGEEIARTYAREGAKVAVLDIKADLAAKVAKDIGANAVPIACDVTSLSAVKDAVAATVKAFGRLDIVVNNAGWSYSNRPVLETPEADFDKVFAINVKSIYNFVTAGVPHMTNGGSIVNIGSTAGLRPRPGLVWYNATKGAVHIASKTLAVELAPKNIRVNVIAPVAGETPLLQTFLGNDTPERRAQFLATIPLGRFSQPRDIANAALFLASPEAEFITGTVLEVDGGRCV
ncbi:MAG TPA: glucose 1-dehydrogenase [Beijerinckiaceae bacterium]|nr:glucose 1-dehydrogenase [Beijerinckiaceae bacterium]